MGQGGPAGEEPWAIEYDPDSLTDLPVDLEAAAAYAFNFAAFRQWLRKTRILFTRVLKSLYRLSRMLSPLLPS